MKKSWYLEELVEHWTLLPKELEQLTQKNDQNTLGFALLLKFFQLEARFPENSSEIPADVVNYVAKLLDIKREKYQFYNWQGRSIKYHRAQIREFFGFREAQSHDTEELVNWLTEQALIYELKFEQLELAALTHLRELKIEPPTFLRLERIIRSALHSFEEKFFNQISQQLSSQSKEAIDNLLNSASSSLLIYGVPNEPTNEEVEKTETTWAELKTDPGRIGIESFQKEIAKLDNFRQLGLPPDLFKQIPTKVLQVYKNRAAIEHPRDLRRQERNYSLHTVCSFLLAEKS